MIVYASACIIFGKGIFGMSKFTGRFWGYFGRCILFSLLSAITLGIAFPFCMCRMLKWQKRHTYINGYRLAFNGNGFQLWGRFLLWLLLTVVTVGLYTFYLPIAWEKWVTKHTYIG